MSSSPIEITVAICTWNRASLLEQTLARLLDVAPRTSVAWRLIVVDNNSTDHTTRVADAFLTRLPMLYAIETRQGLSHARNRALEEARGTHILFTDDDVLVGDGWLDAFAAGIAAYPEAAAFGGPIEPWFQAEPDPDLAAAFPMLAVGFCGILESRPAGLMSAHKEVFGANMGFSRRAIGDLRFDPNLGASSSPGREGEEIEFSSRLRSRGGRLAWLPDMHVRHYVDPARMTLDYLCNYYEGRGRTFIRREGVPPGRRVLGVPTWLFRQWTGHVVGAAGARVISDRRTYLRRRREERYERGMVKECLHMRREAADSTHPRQVSRA